jgi:hypothetical protein
MKFRPAPICGTTLDEPATQQSLPMASETLLVTVICLIIILFAYSLIFQKSETPRVLRGVLQSRNALRSSTLASRAALNQRLVEIFDIDNAFTTTDPVYHSRFTKEIRGKLDTRDEGWRTLATSTFDNLRHIILLKQETQGDKKYVQLTPLVQSLVFRFVLHKFFRNIPSPSEDDVEIITTCINSLWLATKFHGSQADTNLLETQKQLERRLRKVFEKSPTDRINGRASPLNIIIPAYESVWRVALRCFLEAPFHNQGKEINESITLVDYQRIFARFMRDPSPSVFETPFQNTQISIKHVVDEALRLYTPTRRIHRQTEHGMVKIDVEWLHRDSASWGLDAEEFRPRRWEGTRLRGVNGKLAFLPFGLGALSCPAKEFAPMMIGILVAALMGGVGEAWELTDEGNGGDVLSDGVLDGGREAYAGLWLRKIES